MAMAARREKDRNYGRALKRHLLAQSLGRCQYCGCSITLLNSTIDHVDAGGDDTVENYLICCNGCNASKGQKSLEEFRAFMEARELIAASVLPSLNWTTSQLVWLVRQDWFPHKIQPYEFVFERERAARATHAAGAPIVA